MDADLRFDRLEAKLDKLADAMIKLVAIDTKIDGLLVHNNTQDSRLNKHSERMDDADDEIVQIKLEVQKNSGASRFAERVFFLVITAGVGAIAYSLRG